MTTLPGECDVAVGPNTFVIESIKGLMNFTNVFFRDADT
jgi:hypothetical protein